MNLGPLLDYRGKLSRVRTKKCSGGPEHFFPRRVAQGLLPDYQKSENAKSLGISVVKQFLIPIVLEKKCSGTDSVPEQILSGTLLSPYGRFWELLAYGFETSARVP